jgi:hypothetical protein
MEGRYFYDDFAVNDLIDVNEWGISNFNVQGSYRYLGTYMFIKFDCDTPKDEADFAEAVNKCWQKLDVLRGDNAEKPENTNRNMTYAEFYNLMYQSTHRFSDSSWPFAINAIFGIYNTQPLFGLIFDNTSLPFWLLLSLLVIWGVRRFRDRHNHSAKGDMRYFWLAFAPPATYWLMMAMLSPIASFRYVLPALYVVPLLFGLVFQRFTKR